MRWSVLILSPVLGLFLAQAQGSSGELSQTIATAKDMFSIVVPVAGLLLFYERRLSRVEEKLDQTHKDLKGLTESIQRML